MITTFQIFSLSSKFGIERLSRLREFDSVAHLNPGQISMMKTFHEK